MTGSRDRIADQQPTDPSSHPMRFDEDGIELAGAVDRGEQHGEPDDDVAVLSHADEAFLELPGRDLDGVGVRPKNLGVSR